MIKGYCLGFLSRVIDLSKATWTMANQVAFRAMMADLGFGQPAADEVYTGQGVDSIIVMMGLFANDVESLMRIVRKPGGGDDGNAVSFVAERNFKTACQMARHYYQTRTWVMPAPR